MLLTQIVNLPGKFLLKEYDDEALEREAIVRFDR